jgi:metal-sulfur cluster biosynthetic enzyme
MTEMVKGKVLEEVKEITFENIAGELGGLPKIKMHCAVLSKTAIDAALPKYEVKQGRIKIDEILVRRILRGVLDPVEGTDIVSAGMIEGIEVTDRTVTLKLSVAKDSETAKVLEEDIKESFEDINISLNLIFRISS